MSQRKLPGADDALARLTPIQAPEFLDQLVFERALPLLQAHTSPAEAPRAELHVAPTPAAVPFAQRALFTRGALRRLKSWA